MGACVHVRVCSVCTNPTQVDLLKPILKLFSIHSNADILFFYDAAAIVESKKEPFKHIPEIGRSFFSFEGVETNLAINGANIN